MPPLETTHRPLTRPRRVRRLLGVALTALVAWSLFACGNDAAAPPAVVSPENVEDLAFAAMEAASRGTASALLAAGLLDITTSPALAPGSGVSAAVSPGGADPLCSSGRSEIGSSSVRFFDCVVSDLEEVCVVNGRLDIKVNLDKESFDARFRNLRIDCEGLAPETLDGDRLVCRNFLSSNIECDYDFSSFRGSYTGIKYKVRSVDLAWDEDLGGLMMSAEIVDPDHGVFEMETTQLVVFDECAGGEPSSGQVLFRGVPPSYGLIDFIDCDGFDVCFYASDLTAPDCMEYDWATINAD